VTSGDHRVTPGGSDAAARAAALADAAVAGDRRALARLLTAVEASSPVGEAAVRILHSRAGHAHVVGVTGAPGSGKSTLVNAMLRELRARGRTVAVVAVDPSSPITGGAILGDRVRMQEHATDAGVFIRSMAARGHAGGLSATTDTAIIVLDAAGFDVIVVETVGTGQSEVEVAAAADTTLVLEAPEMGDEVQAIKAGLLEVADIVVVSKGDRPGAERTANLLRTMLGPVEPQAHEADVTGEANGAQEADGTDGAPAHAGPPRRPRRRTPDVLITTGATGGGVAALVDALDRRGERMETGPVPEARVRRAATLVWTIVAERVRADLASRERAAETWALVREVAAHEIDPYAAADALLATRDASVRRDEEG
jgi:LAO/AO transport system kinase